MKKGILFYERKMIIPVKGGAETRYYGELKYIIYNSPYCDLYFNGNNKPYKVEMFLHELFEELPAFGVGSECYHPSAKKRYQYSIFH